MLHGIKCFSLIVEVNMISCLMSALHMIRTMLDILC